jgi:chorismate-pyruvate lyase
MATGGLVSIPRADVSLDPTKELRLLHAFFGETALPKSKGVAGATLPEPYRTLLVHNHHMTVTLEEHHKSPLRVVPYRVQRTGEIYGRKLDLLRSDGKTVMTGIMLINFTFCDATVRDEILSEKKPLGRILIEHGVLREVAAAAFVRIAADDPLVARFNLSNPRPAYGRLAEILCNGKPAIDLLEVVAPE